MGSLLIDEYPLLVLPSLAKRVGLNESIALQQLHFLLGVKGSGRSHAGHKWIYNTYEEWRESYFPFWSCRTIERVFDSLEVMHLVESCQPEGRVSRRKWYRLNRGTLSLLISGRIPEPANLSSLEPANLAGWEPAKLSSSLGTETSSETSSETTAARGSLGLDADAFETSALHHVPHDLRLALPPGSARPPKHPPRRREPPRASDAGREDADFFRSLLPPMTSLEAGWQDIWGAAFDRLASDGRDPDEVRRVCRWARIESFWSPHVLSPVRLVKRKDGAMLYDRLLAAMRASTAVKSCEPKM